MKIKAEMFEVDVQAFPRHYALAGGSFYFWSAGLCAWVSSNEQERISGVYEKMKAFGYVKNVELKGRIIP